MLGVEQSLPNLSSCVKARRPRRRPSPKCLLNTSCRKTQWRRQPVQVSVVFKLTIPTSESQGGLRAAYEKSESSQSTARMAKSRPSCSSEQAGRGDIVQLPHSPLTVLVAGRRPQLWQFGCALRTLGRSSVAGPSFASELPSGNCTTEQAAPSAPGP